MSKLWERFFLRERPSIGLAFFRLAVALTVGCHVLPTFFPLKQNYLSGSFRILNAHFFPIPVLEWIQKSPDSLIIALVWIFCVAWVCFLIGLFTQASCIVMTLGCYYFYALNAFAIGTLSWDILLVTLFLMCVTGYPGDYFSVDCLRKRDPLAFQRRRPYFLQRLLQIQIAFTYFYTGLYKITAEGNWLTGNPVYYLMQYPASGVTKYFLIRDWMATHPGFCYWVGILIVGIELFMPFLLFNKKTRVSGIYLGFIFHILLILTLDVPAIFFFLFPAQLLLFVDPEKIVAWIGEKRQFYSQAPQIKVIYDGNCQFCTASIEMLKPMDLWGRLAFVNYQTQENFQSLHPDLTKEKAHSQLYVIDLKGNLHGGFFAFRKMAFVLPMLYPLLLVFYFPGSGVVGPLVYRWVAEHRYLFHLNKKCANNACFR